MVDTAKLAALLGKEDNDAFKQQVDAAVADLERQLGYALCGATEAEPRVFDYKPQYLWQRLHPFYGNITSVVVTDEWQTETTISAEDYQLGQNGSIQLADSPSWFNGLKLCKDCYAKPCICYERCAFMTVTAKWGFGPLEPADESGESPGAGEFCYLPDDLYNVLVAAVRAGTDVKGKGDIQSESTSTRSYSKFAASYKTVWERYADVIGHYAFREQRF